MTSSSRSVVRNARRWLLLLGAVTVATGVVAAPANAARKPAGTITVSAAASLTDAFTALGRQFERRNPKATVTLNFAASSALVAQIQAGAPADVFASADLESMDKLLSGRRVASTPRPFAGNVMELAVKPGNPEDVQGVADLSKVRTVALCSITAPCGVYAARVLERAGVTLAESKVTRNVDAKATLAAVSLGDADAAIVYATDVRAAGTAVRGVIIPAEQNVDAVYAIAALADPANPRLAKAFVSYVVSSAGQRALARYGFLAP